jgi:hypothetical protein
MLFCLILHGDTPVSRRTVVESAIPEGPPSLKTSRKTIRRYTIVQQCTLSGLLAVDVLKASIGYHKHLQ